MGPKEYAIDPMAQAALKIALMLLHDSREKTQPMKRVVLNGIMKDLDDYESYVGTSTNASEAARAQVKVFLDMDKEAISAK